MRNPSLNRANRDLQMNQGSLREGLLHKSTNSEKTYPNTPFQILLIFLMILLTYGIMSGLFAGILAWANKSPNTPLIVFAILYGVFWVTLIALTVYGDRKRADKERQMIEAKLREKEEESNNED